MARYHYTKPTRAALLDQVLAQVPGLTARNTRMEGTATDVWLTVPDIILEPTIAAVVAAHDATALDAAAQAAAAQDATARAGVQALAPAFLAGTDLTLAQLNQVMRWLARRQLAQGD